MVELQYFGHSFFRIGGKAGNVIIDPVFDSTKTDLKRIASFPVKPKDLKNVSFLLLTNETPEHFDRRAVEEIATASNATVVAHDVVLKQLNLPRNMKLPISSNSEIFLRGAKIKTAIAHYPKSFYPMGFIVDLDNTKIYHAGVTALLENFSETRADVALLPIGGKHTMDVVDAVRATKMIKPRIVVPMQYNTFEPTRADPKDFKKRIEKSLIKTRPIVLSPGETIRV
ncbi:MAG: MBL fold metallo-hydrolase [Candidatus Diapherotrites archaeon]|nr:MBL fold metallo-hydrolase [Candidatus Diapherotrites archaeon]